MDSNSVRAGDRVPHGGDSDPDVLDFSANTNPRVPNGTEKVYAAAFDDARRYPDDGYPAFREAAAAVVGCDAVDVVPTPGGLAAIRLAIATQVDPGDSVLVPVPGFSEYAREVKLQGGEPSFVAHDQLVEADPSAHAMAVVCTPNNPTGEAANPGALRAFAERCRDAGTELLVDEAFLDYTDLPSMAGTDGVVVARSLTKLFGLPGIRMGYAVATGARRDDLATARRAWNLSTPAAAVSAYCLRQREFVQEIREQVETERARMQTALATEYEVFRSDAPFLLLDVGDRDVEAVVSRARDRSVAIRDATTFRRLDSHVRVAVKDRAANDQLLEAMDVRNRM